MSGMHEVDRREAAALLLRHWDPLHPIDVQPPTEYLREADALIGLMRRHGADARRLSEYLAQSGLGARDVDREREAAVAVATWYAHRASCDPWIVQIELVLTEQLHHHVVEELTRRLAPFRADVRQSVDVLVVNMEVAVRDPLEAGREALQRVRDNSPVPDLLYRLTLWRYVV